MNSHQATLLRAKVRVHANRIERDLDQRITGPRPASSLVQSTDIPLLGDKVMLIVRSGDEVAVRCMPSADAKRIHDQVDNLNRFGKPVTS